MALSASSQLAYGSIAVLVPAEPSVLAMLVIHEVQHMTLSAVLDLEPLYSDGGEPRHHAPWRLDPRPVGQLLQGTFAHFGVTDFWRAQRHRETGTARDQANFEFAYWRELTTRAIRTLAGLGELTAAGLRFVHGLQSTMDGQWSAAVPASTVDAARAVAEADTVLAGRNQEPDRSAAAELARRRRDGEPCPPSPRRRSDRTRLPRPAGADWPPASATGCWPSALCAARPRSSAMRRPATAPICAATSTAPSPRTGPASPPIRNDADAWVGLALTVSPGATSRRPPSCGAGPNSCGPSMSP